MSLKQSIVVRNQFTFRTAGGGSRGKTPGRYVLEYMARNLATEDLTPVRLSEVDGYIQRYMAREEATERAGSVPELKAEMARAQRYGGVAFGYGDVSLSHEKLIDASRDIQARFDEGKTVMKTVLSFTPDYLKKMGLVDPDFECERPGDYRGNLDQLKLRMAVMNGLRRLGRDFDDLQYVGVIQVDTEHVHCHLAMVDRGRGRLTRDGTQRGKLSARQIRELRRGVDDFLDENQASRMLSSNVNYDKRNTVCYVKRLTHNLMAREGLPQFLLACLPEDSRLWRARSNDRSMRKANYIVREYVGQVLARPDSGYRQALQAVDLYAQRRQRVEGLSDEEYRALYKAGRDRVVDGCVNGVYDVLRHVPERERRTRTPMLAAMSLEFEEMAGQASSDPMVEFGFRLRSYSSRLEFHKRERHKYREAYESYASRDDISEDARPVVDFLRFEAEYQEMLMSKYQHFLSFLPPEEEYQEEFERVAKYRRRLSALSTMSRDKSMRQMRPENAERYGQDAYGVRGGRLVAENPAALEGRVAAMRARFEEMRAELEERLSDYGMSLSEGGPDDAMSVSRAPRYDFEDVKALDVHHLGYDFPTDVPISKRNVDAFRETAARRAELYDAAAAYLTATGQGAYLRALPGRDVEVMRATADRLAHGPVLRASRSRPSGGRGARTTRLDANYRRDLDLAVLQAVEFAAQLERE